MISRLKKLSAAVALSVLAVASVATPSSASQRWTVTICPSGHSYSCLIEAINTHISIVGDRPENCRAKTNSRNGVRYYKCTTTYATTIPA